MFKAGDFYDYDGEPISAEEFTGLCLGKDHEMVRWRVGVTEVEGWFVSTVWLGINHRFSGDGPPLIFETLAAHPDHGEITRRYSTAEEALAGHNALVEEIRTIEAAYAKGTK